MREKRMVKMQKRGWNCAMIFAVTLSFITITGSAFAYDLSDKDYEYLKTQHIERDHAPVLDLSPKERSRLHVLINEPRTDAVARDENIKNAVALFLEHQLWEKAHPGELWDVPPSSPRPLD
jgi:hypothetical protein